MRSAVKVAFGGLCTCGTRCGSCKICFVYAAHTHGQVVPSRQAPRPPTRARAQIRIDLGDRHFVRLEASDCYTIHTQVLSALGELALPNDWNRLMNNSSRFLCRILAPTSLVVGNHCSRADPKSVGQCRGVRSVEVVVREASNDAFRACSGGSGRMCLCTRRYEHWRQDGSGTIAVRK